MRIGCQSQMEPPLSFVSAGKAITNLLVLCVHFLSPEMGSVFEAWASRFIPFPTIIENFTLLGIGKAFYSSDQDDRGCEVINDPENHAHSELNSLSHFPLVFLFLALFLRLPVRSPSASCVADLRISYGRRRGHH